MTHAEGHRAVALAGVERVAGHTLDSRQPLRRLPPRPPALRDAAYDAEFDEVTLFYDAVFDAARDTVRIICPALLNLSPEVRAGTFVAQPQGRECKAKITVLDRQVQIHLKVPPGTSHLLFSSKLGNLSIHPRTSDQELFRNERVVLTVQKDNHLKWLRDWAKFYEEVHNATAFCVYDNGSTSYEDTELHNAIAEACPSAKVLVVQWPFKFGPVGKGSKKWWDSNFCKLGALEHARWMYLQSARSVLNCDIDELVLSESSDSVFERAEKSRFGVVSFYGSWIIGVDGITRVKPGDADTSFADFSVALKGNPRKTLLGQRTDPLRCAPKWALVPARCPSRAQWNVHKVGGWLASRLIDDSLRFRHFREISTNWKYLRTDRPAYDPMLHADDVELMAVFEKMKWLSSKELHA